MDLTTAYPNSVKTKLHGIVQLQRTLDKGEALAHGNIGEYHYNCAMDQGLFAFLGIDHEALLDVIKNADGPHDVIDYVGTFVHRKTPAEIEAWNADWLKMGPKPGSESYDYFMDLRKQLAPDRTDVTAWADLLDLDERRPVPKAAAV